jgi:hypothetical protein
MVTIVGDFTGTGGILGYLKWKLASKGGIRRERLPFYLGEYIGCTIIRTNLRRKR